MTMSRVSLAMNKVIFGPARTMDSPVYEGMRDRFRIFTRKMVCPTMNSTISLSTKTAKDDFGLEA